MYPAVMSTMTRSLSQPQRYGPRNTFHGTADSPFAMTWVSAHSPVTSGVHTGIAAQPTPSPRGAGSGGAGAGRSGSFLSTQNIRRYHFPGPLFCTVLFASRLLQRHVFQQITLIPTAPLQIFWTVNGTILLGTSCMSTQDMNYAISAG